MYKERNVMQRAIGVDVGATKIASAIVTRDRVAQATRQTATRVEQGADMVIRRIADEINALRQQDAAAKSAGLASACRVWSILWQESSLMRRICVGKILRGANNRERLIGSRAYIQALLGARSVGLIATHDLELAHLADANSHAHNYHFRDDVA